MQVFYTRELLENSREEQDTLADQVIADFFPEQKNTLRAILEAVQDNAYIPSETMPGSVHQLWQDVYQNPLLMDEKLQAVGQRFFARYSGDIMLLLGFLSLPYCYAAANGSEVLIRSNRIKDEPEKRLLETAQFVFDVMAPGAFGEQGKGLAAILKVRLMHAAIRYYVRSDETWSTAYGNPINQEDMAGTNLSFSLIPIRGLRKLGRSISAAESLGYIEYWNLTGRLLGLKSELLPESVKAANVLERKIRQRQFRYSAAGTVLTDSLLKYFERATRGTALDGKSRPFVYFLLGDSIADLLGIAVDPLQQGLFKPIQQFILLKNIFINQADTYLNSLQRFAEQQAILEEKIDFKLPHSISAASGAS